MGYDIFATENVEKAIAWLLEDTYQRMNDAIDALATTPDRPAVRS